MRHAGSVLAWLLAACVAAFALLRAGVGQGTSEGVALVAFTPYAAAAAVPALIVVVLLRRWLPAAVGGAALLVLAAAVVPRAVGPGQAEASGRPLTVLSSNTRFGSVSPRALAALARRSRADVLSLQELTPDLVKALDRVDGFRRRYPHRVLRARPGSAGTGLLSRYPLERIAPPVAPGHLTTAARAEIRGLGEVELLAVHPVAPRGAGETAKWRAGLRALPAADRAEPPRILAGDFNATLDHRELRRLLALGYQDAAERTGDALVPTFPVHPGRLPALVTIDHVLADRRLEVLGTRIETVPGTDHRAVLARLSRPDS